MLFLSMSHVTRKDDSAPGDTTVSHESMKSSIKAQLSEPHVVLHCCTMMPSYVLNHCHGAVVPSHPILFVVMQQLSVFQASLLSTW